MSRASSILLALVTCAAASNYTCSSLIVPVGVTNVTTIIPPFTLPNQYAAVAFANSAVTRDSPSLQVSFKNLTKVFNISAEYCTPTQAGDKISILQVLTHGLGFDRSYWDFYLPNSTNASYSYISAATAAGYSTLSWNRLGIQPSTIADPYSEIQALVELAILANLTALVRAGAIKQVPLPSKVLHVGHSWGSQLSNALVATSPQLSDGVIFTGYSHDLEFSGLFLSSTTLHLANTNQPHRFPSTIYSNGFLTWPDEAANQFAFLEYPFFDPTVLSYAEATKYPFTAGEFFSQALLPVEAEAFTGPVLYLASSNDLIFCASNCTGLPALQGPDASAVTAFNASSSIEVYIQPNVGHGLNLHYNATGAYSVMLEWASRHGF